LPYPEYGREIRWDRRGEIFVPVFSCGPFRNEVLRCRRGLDGEVEQDVLDHVIARNGLERLRVVNPRSRVATTIVQAWHATRPGVDPEVRRCFMVDFALMLVGQRASPSTVSVSAPVPDPVPAPVAAPASRDATVAATCSTDSVLLE
jgi:hypothetical protein